MHILKSLLPLLDRTTEKCDIRGKLKDAKNR